MNTVVPAIELIKRELTPQSTTTNFPVNPLPEFSLLVAGCRGGKTSLLRLLLDTCNISPRATRDQLASVAKFVQGCGSHTTHIRSTSIPVDHEAGGEFTLSLVDTPSLDFKDAAATERSMLETLRYIEGRLGEAADAEWDQQDRLVHLCVYFLDPDQIIPSSIPAPPAPVVPRTRTNSFSQPDQEPVILEPPVTNNPLLYKPTLPPLDVLCIRRLSARVNVLPVIARADVLSNDRLSAIKMAVRRDLAEAGIGFGIFDVEAPYQLPEASDSSNGHGAQPNLAAARISPPTSPNTHTMLRLPYALISPDLYAHSDGVVRMSPSRSDLMQTYTPSQFSQPPPKLVRGKFTRIYRWGSLDVLDPNHCDFLHLRSAIFHHMETLQKYTREYLFEKFRADYKLPPHQQQPLPSSRHSLAHISSTHSRIPSFGQPSRPVLAIDTAPNRPNVLPAPQAMSIGRDVQTAPMSRNVSDNVSVKSNGSTDTTTKGSKQQRPKKITVACNFCRSRKLKCDGGRPSCTQCIKRSHPCDYMPQNRRRRGVPRRTDEESESDSADDPSDAPSMSPQAASRPHSRRNSIFEKHSEFGPSSLPPITGGDMSSSSRSRGTAGPSAFETELPHIATLSLPDPSPSTPGPPMSAPSLPPIRPASEHQSAQRKRASTVPGKSTRQTSHSGPKVVACNFCRARKTKCDGAHPACSSCARRSLSCSYVTDRRSAGDKRRASTSSKAATTTAQRPPPPTPMSDYMPSPPSSRMVPTPSTGVPDLYERRDVMVADQEGDLKRSSEYMDNLRPPKKMRVENTTGIP
ncbi:GTP binding protein [Lentinula raphanica]|nr:hypothetical protein C8R42DRAFT_697697 [Lentinula raphanica]KAJ3773211.1 GTP binding protein [Lentinula raphanica]KAJ3825848.1 GTP binding protein [Lentinula raphanica]